MSYLPNSGEDLEIKWVRVTLRRIDLLQAQKNRFSSVSVSLQRDDTRGRSTIVGNYHQQLQAGPQGENHGWFEYLNQHSIATDGF